MAVVKVAKRDVTAVRSLMAGCDHGFNIFIWQALNYIVHVLEMMTDYGAPTMTFSILFFQRIIW